MSNVIRVASRESREVVKSYRDLRVWQQAMVLSKDVFNLLKTMPKEELYGLTSQIKRAVVSIPSNIAEGSSRRSTQEYLRFINISTGSLAELETQLILASELEYLSKMEVDALLQATDDLSRMLQGLYNSLSKKTRDSRLATRNTNSEE